MATSMVAVTQILANSDINRTGSQAPQAHIEF